MVRRNDRSPYPQEWTNAKLIAEIRSKANLASFADMPGEKRPATPDNIREVTRIYRESWLNPLLDELERRVLKTKKAA